MVNTMIMIHTRFRFVDNPVSPLEHFLGPYPIFYVSDCFIKWYFLPQRLSYHAIGIMEKAILSLNPPIQPEYYRKVPLVCILGKCKPVLSPILYCYSFYNFHTHLDFFPPFVNRDT